MLPSLSSYDSAYLHIFYAKHFGNGDIRHFSFKASDFNNVFICKLASPLPFAAANCSVGYFIIGVLLRSSPSDVFWIYAPFFPAIMSGVYFWAWIDARGNFTNKSRHRPSFFTFEGNPRPLWVAMSCEWPTYASIFIFRKKVIKKFPSFPSWAYNRIAVSVPNKSGIMLYAHAFALNLIGAITNFALHVLPQELRSSINKDKQ